MALALVAAVAGCFNSSHIWSPHPHGAPTQQVANPRTAQPAAPRRSPARMSARVELPSRTMTAVSSMPGRVVVENNTGRAIHASGCLALFQVELISGSYHPSVAWPLCLQPFTIPAGRSSYPVTVEASPAAARVGASL